MIFKLSIILLPLVCFSINNVISSEWNCNLHFQFAKLCHRFDFNDNSCVEWDTSKCEIVKTTYNDYRCPTFICAKNPTDAIEKILLDSSKIERFEEEVLSHSNYFTTKEPSKHIKHEVVTAIKPSRPFGSTTTPTTTPTLTTTVRKLMPTLQITPSTTSIRRGTFDQTNEKLKTFDGITRLTLMQTTTTRPTLMTSTATNQPTFIQSRATTRPTLMPSTAVTQTTTIQRNLMPSRATTQPTLMQTTATTKLQVEEPQMKISMTVNMDQVKMKRQKRKGKVESSIFLVTKKEEKPLKQISFRSASNDRFGLGDGIDCGTKMCYLEYRVQPDCYLILETNNTNCKIPCLMEGCDTELHHFISCPVWNCELISTTTRSTTSTSGTSSPRPKPNKPSDMSALMYTSIVINIFFFAILCAFIIGKFRAWMSARFPRAPINAPDPNLYFSLGENRNEDFENETDPLISSGAGGNELVRHGSTNLVAGNVNAVTTHAIIESDFAIENANVRGELEIENKNQIQDLQLALPSTSNWDAISLASSSPDSNVPTNSKPSAPVENSLFQFMKKKAKK